MAHVLIPLPDSDFDVTEVAVPWRLLTRNGHRVTFVTEHGNSPPQADPLLLSGVLFGQLGAEPEPKAFYREMIASSEFLQPRPWDSLQVSEFDGLILPGGHAKGMRQYLGSESLRGKVREFFALKRPVGAICHGVLVAARADVLRGHKTTCLPKYMERTAYYLTAWKLGSYYRTYPAYVEDEVRAALASPSDFLRGPITLSTRGTEQDDSAAFVVESDFYLSARWPGDAYLFGKRFLQKLPPS
jgi:putative intracellular protease/amidase